MENLKLYQSQKSKDPLLSQAILSYCLKYQGDWQKIARALSQSEPFEEKEFSGHFITLMDDVYPVRLKGLRYPPWILFYEGNLELLALASVGIVGSRDISPYGRWCTEKICAALLDKRVIVSGMAKGIDAKAHLCSMNGKTIGVLGCGLDVIYPRENQELYRMMKKKQLLISEYPPQTPPLKHHFPWRNRIIAALSDKLAIPQAKIRSGTLLTVNHACELGKEVYCVPTSLDDPSGTGGNELIENGAFILNHFDDLL